MQYYFPNVLIFLLQKRLFYTLQKPLFKVNNYINDQEHKILFFHKEYILDPEGS